MRTAASNLILGQLPNPTEWLNHACFTEGIPYMVGVFWHSICGVHLAWQAMVTTEQPGIGPQSLGGQLSRLSLAVYAGEIP